MPARVVLQFIVGTPTFLVKWRIGHNKVGLQVLVLVVVECVGSLFAKIAGYATNGKVHLCKLISGIGIFLSVNGDVTFVAMMSLYKLHTLHKHTPRSTAGVVYLATIRLYDFGNKVYDTLRRIIFTLALSFGYGKLGKKVLIYTAY